jgi:hypothetical protein
MKKKRGIKYSILYPWQTYTIQNWLPKNWSWIIAFSFNSTREEAERGGERGRKSESKRAQSGKSKIYFAKKIYINLHNWWREREYDSERERERDVFFKKNFHSHSICFKFSNQSQSMCSIDYLFWGGPFDLSDSTLIPLLLNNFEAESEL